MTQVVKTVKIVTVLYTYIFKAIDRVCFVVLSSDGETRYNTCFDQGKASCTCPAHTECYHITQLRPRYQAIRERRAIRASVGVSRDIRQKYERRYDEAMAAYQAEQEAAVAEERAEVKMAAYKAGMDYDVLATTKTTAAERTSQPVFGTCGHLAKRADRSCGCDA